MKLPVSRIELQNGGYRFEFARPCKRCGAQLEFHRTPSRSLAPLETVIVAGVWLLDSHFKTCPFAIEFSRQQDARQESKQGDLFGGKK
jgi:hypothetical protein